MMDYNLNIIPKNLDNGLNNIAIMGGKYIYLQEAPDNANIIIKINNNQNDGIVLTKGKAIVLPQKANQFFISADSVSGANAVFVVSDNENFKITDTPSFAFNESAKNSLRFAPRNEPLETIVSGGSSYEFLKGGNTAIDFIAFNTSDLNPEFINVSLDESTVKRPYAESNFSLDYIEEKVIFHNDNSFDLKLIVWSM